MVKKLSKEIGPLSMRFFFKHCCQLAVMTMLLASLSACMVGPDFDPPTPPKVKHYTEPPWPHKTVSVSGEAGASQHFLKKCDVSPQWWRSFHSQKLNKLVCRGLANSPNLIAAKAVLREAQENLNASVGGLFPAFTAQLSAQRGSSAGFFNSNASNSTVTGSNIPTGSRGCPHSKFRYFVVTL